jgi:hypothetical protein
MQPSAPAPSLQEAFLTMISNGELLDVRAIPSEEPPGTELILGFRYVSDAQITKYVNALKDLASKEGGLNSINPNHTPTSDQSNAQAISRCMSAFIDSSTGIARFRLYPHDGQRAADFVKAADQRLEEEAKKNPFAGVLRYKSRFPDDCRSTLFTILHSKKKAEDVDNAIQRLKRTLQPTNEGEKIDPKDEAATRSRVQENFEVLRASIADIMRYKDSTAKRFVKSKPSPEIMFCDDVVNFFLGINKYYLFLRDTPKPAAQVTPPR